MSGFGAFVRGVRADVASRRDARRSATEDAATTTGAARAPFLSTRLKPISDARKLWASATQSRLGMETSFSGGSDRVAFVTEPRTGLKLPGSFCVRGKTSDCAPLAGMGVRVKRIAGIGVKVYACGLYVDPEDARAALGDRFVGRDVADVGKDQSLFDGVLRSDDVDKTVRLAFARNIDSAKIRDALSERLRPALGRDSESLKTFETYFDGVTFEKGQALTFSATGGKLETTMKGKSVGVIHDARLCAALFDAYLGRDPVVPSAKRSLGEALAARVVG